MNIVVYGASGYIGGAIARRFQKDGANVRVTARTDESRKRLQESGFTVIDAHLGDPNALAKAAEGCEVAIHAAGIADRKTNRSLLGWTQVAGTENVVTACRHAGVKRLTFISCADVTLQKAPRMNWNEDRVLTTKGFDAHAETMARAEEFVIGSGTADFQTLALRPAFVWGPGGEGPSDLGTAPALCAEGLDRGLSLFGPGKRLVGVTYIDHLTEAAWLAATAPTAPGSIFHVVDQELCLSREYYSALSKALGLPKPRKAVVGLAAASLAKRLGKVGEAEILRRRQSNSFDQERARKQLGFVPFVTHEQGMKVLAKWVTARGGPAALAAAKKQTPVSS